MLDVVDHFEQGDCHDGLADEIPEGNNAKKVPDGRNECHFEQEIAKHPISEESKAITFQSRDANLLDLPRGFQPAEHGAPPKPVDRLSSRRRGRIYWRGDPPVMSY